MSSPSHSLKTFLVFCFLILSSSVVWAEPPIAFSFRYDGQKADLNQFKLQSRITDSNDQFESWLKTWTAPDGQLQIELKGKTFKKYPATEYAVTLRNLSDHDSTGIVSEFQSLDAFFPIATEPEIRTLLGSHCGPDDFTPVVETLPPGKKRTFSTPSGRSSNEFMPFLELNFDTQNGQLFAVGWTGSWKTEFLNDGKRVNVQLGMLQTHFRLLPSESLRLPGVLLFERQGMSRMEFQTVLYRFMLENKLPRDSKGGLFPPIHAITAGGGNKTPEMMLAILKHKMDNQFHFDTFWVDAGWYGAPHEDEHYSNCGPNWWKYVGDWRVNTATHPSGTLLPIANAVHEANMNFLLWFEPERVHESSPIRKEHPEYFLGNLLNLGNPSALKWIQDSVYGMIASHGIDVYRQDFNMDPGPSWRQADAQNPERVGTAEAKHIENLYVFLDEMRRRFPDIQQENCASGGRRIDVEMISRAHSYCRSDYPIGRKPGDTAFIFGQNATRNTVPFLPFQGSEFNCVPIGDDYAALSAISSGLVHTPTDFNGGIVRREFSTEELQWFQKIFSVASQMKPYWSGFFYPLTEETDASDDVWCGWQLDDPQKQAGFALVFRRGNATEESRVFQLGGICPDATYAVESFNGEKKTLVGSDLQEWRVSIPKRSFELIFYQKQ